MRPSALLRFYAWRLRRHPVQELFAASGIATGVALVFAVQVANTSIAGSAERVVEGIAGSAELRVATRSPAGFDAAVLERARELPGVHRAAPLTIARVALAGPRATRSVQLVGTTPDLATLGGELTRNFGPGGLQLPDGLTLPAATADAIGVAPGQRVDLLVGGERRRVLVGAVLDRAVVGALATSPIAIARLPVAQRLTETPGRLSQVLVDAEPGAAATVERRLRALAGGRMTVEPVAAEQRMLRQASEPNDQSTALFSAIGAMVGLMLAFSAMLLTVPERRRFLADLRMQGFEPRQLLAMLAFEAATLGLVASLAGVALGDLLSRALFSDVPEYLTFAFLVGTQRVVETETIVLAIGGGVVAALVASAVPALDLASKRPVDAVLREPGEAGEAIGSGAARWLLAGALALAGATTVAVGLAPAATALGVVALAVAALLALPAAFAVLVRAAGALTRRARGSMIPIAVLELRATTMRSVALAGVAALAVYGSVAIEGARRDLVRGLDQATEQRLAAADVWVTSAADQLYATEGFDPAHATAALARVPGVAGVRRHYGRFVDLGDRRLWLIARPPESPWTLPPSQIVEGDHAEAERRLHAGGWVTVSSAIADARGLGVGDRLALPTPRGDLELRVAAITTNLGWPAGSIVASAADYRRGWGGGRPTALAIDLAPGVGAEAGRRAVEAALSPGSAVRVRTSAEWIAETGRQTRDGLARLSQISLLLLIAAALAVASAMGGAIWQRRPRLAALRIQGFDARQLWRSLMLETGFVVCVGCGVGGALGLFGHLLLTRWLEVTTGFPAPFSAWDTPALGALALVAGIALAVAAIPGYAAARVPPRAVFQE